MFEVNSLKFARTKKEYEQGGFAGYYRVLKNGVQLLDENRVLFAYLVRNRWNEVIWGTASLFNGRAFYMHAFTHDAQRKLGVKDMPYGQECEAFRSALIAWERARAPQTALAEVA